LKSHTQTTFSTRKLIIAHTFTCSSFSHSIGLHPNEKSCTDDPLIHLALGMSNFENLSCVPV